MSGRKPSLNNTESTARECGIKWYVVSRSRAHLSRPVDGDGGVCGTMEEGNKPGWVMMAAKSGPLVKIGDFRVQVTV